MMYLPYENAVKATLPNELPGRGWCQDTGGGNEFPVLGGVSQERRLTSLCIPTRPSFTLLIGVYVTIVIR